MIKHRNSCLRVKTGLNQIMTFRNCNTLQNVDHVSHVGHVNLKIFKFLILKSLLILISLYNIAECHLRNFYFAYFVIDKSQNNCILFINLVLVR